MKLAITITFSEMVENNVGMEKIGQLVDDGFNIDDIQNAKSNFEKLGADCELHCLNDALKGTEFENNAEKAYVLIIRNGANVILNSQNTNSILMMNELTSFEWDTKALMRGVVKNKQARHNVCFSEQSQKADFAKGKGSVIAFKDVECTNLIRNKLGEIVGEKANMLLAEGNKYNDVSINGIGFHGDGERIRVIALRLGKSFPLVYSWFHRFKPVGKRIEFMLNDGDMYIMSEKSVGRDWKKSSKITLRHAAGAQKYLKFKD